VVAGLGWEVPVDSAEGADIEEFGVEDAEEVEDFVFERGVLEGQLGQTLHGAGLYDRTGVVEPPIEHLGNSAALGPCEFEAGDDEAEMPAQLDRPRLDQQP